MQPVEITPQALARLRDLLQEQGMEGMALRLYVAGGCSCSPQVGMAFDQKQPQDHCFEVEDLEVVIDPMSLEYLQGARLDYVNTPEGEGFALYLATAHHHHEDGGCGCH